MLVGIIFKLHKISIIHQIPIINSLDENGRKAYFAYGMNTNKEEMQSRCPNAIFIDTLELSGLRLVFRTVADVNITFNRKDSVKGVVWSITSECEQNLDYLEGYPDLYKKNYSFFYKKRKIMLYVMTAKSKKRKPLNIPNDNYKRCLLKGYQTYGLPTVQLLSALGEANLTRDERIFLEREGEIMSQL